MFLQFIPEIVPIITFCFLASSLYLGNKTWYSKGKEDSKLIGKGVHEKHCYKAIKYYKIHSILDIYRSLNPLQESP